MHAHSLSPSGLVGKTENRADEFAFSEVETSELEAVNGGYQPQLPAGVVAADQLLNNIRRAEAQRAAYGPWGSYNH